MTTDVLGYTITSFDAVTRQLIVEFADDGYANIQLRTPLPSNKEELEAIIKTFAASQEVVAGRSTTADLSYISDLVNVPQTCARHTRLAVPQATNNSASSLDPEAEALLAAAEDKQFRNRVLAILAEQQASK